MTSDRAQELISQFSQQTILVVGDLMLDRFIYGTVDRISPEAPVPVLQVTHEVNMPGGACNVAANIQALGAQAAISGIVGDDTAGQSVKDELVAAGVDVRNIMSLPEYRTILKTRIIAEKQQVVRVDRELPVQMNDEVLQKFTAKIGGALRSANGVIIEDYGKGLIEQQVVNAILQIAEENRIPSGYDPKDNHELHVAGVSIATPNRKEAFMAAGLPESRPKANPLQDQALLRAGQALLDRWAPDYLMMTLGPKGMLLLSQGDDPVHVPTAAREVYDVSGAGDTVVAVSVLALAAGATYHEAAELANAAAGIVVAKLGTAVCTREELLEAVV